MALDRCYKNPKGKLQIFCNSMPNKWHAMGVTLSAGGSLRWFRDALGKPEKEISKKTKKSIYDILCQKASKVEPGSERLIFLPYLMGERCPHIDPNARGAFIGLTLRHDKNHLIRSVLEGVMFSLRAVTEVMREMGVPVNQIRTSGGGALSKLWRQVHADVFNSEVFTVSGSGEGGAYGAAFVAGVGVGIWSSIEEAVKALKVETKTSSLPKNVEIYSKLFNIYQSL
jgi:xylulokinase